MARSGTTTGRPQRRLTVAVRLTAVALASVACTLSVGAATAAAGDPSKELIVKFDPAASASAETQAVARQGATIEDRAALIDAAVVAVAEGKTRSQTEAALNRSAAVDYAEPNDEVQATTDVNDPYYSSQWALPEISWPAALGMIGLSNNTYVAVTDTGLDRNHADISSHLWTNGGEIPSNGLDDDHNGIVDDFYGADFYNNDGNPMDDNGHGTHVSGIIAATTNNYQGVAGVVPNGRVMAVKFLGASGSGSTWGAIQAIQYAVAHNAKVINASWGGGGYSQSLRDAIHAAGQSGALFVAAAGNSGRNNDSQPFYPASYDEPNIISVAATTQSDGLASFSNYGGQSVDLGAPGTSIISTYPNNSYAYLSGTSMAAPFVSGAASLLQAVKPSLTYTEVRDTLFGSVDQTSALQGRTATGGRLNVGAAVAKVVGPSTQQPPSAPSDDPPDSTDPGPDSPADPATDFPDAFMLVSPRNRSIIRSRGRARSSRKVLASDGRIILDWSESTAVTGVASYTVVVDRRVEEVARDPDGRSGPATPETQVALDVKPGRHSWYVVARSWAGTSRVNTYLRGSAKRYFTFQRR